MLVISWDTCQVHLGEEGSCLSESDGSNGALGPVHWDLEHVKEYNTFVITNQQQIYLLLYFHDILITPTNSRVLIQAEVKIVIYSRFFY